MPSLNLIEPPVISCGMVHTKITEERVAQALLTQLATKASPAKIR